jgi:hypothetical protein
VHYLRPEQDFARAHVLGEVKDIVNAHGDAGCNIAGFAFVIWASDNASTATVRCGPLSTIPSVAMPEFIKQRLLAAKIEEWSKI